MNEYTPQTKKPSKLESFKLFYEAVPAPDYIAKASDGERKSVSPRDRRLARRRK